MLMSEWSWRKLKHRWEIEFVCMCLGACIDCYETCLEERDYNEQKVIKSTEKEKPIAKLFSTLPRVTNKNEREINK